MRASDSSPSVAQCSTGGRRTGGFGVIPSRYLLNDQARIQAGIDFSPCPVPSAYLQWYRCSWPQFSEKVVIGQFIGLDLGTTSFKGAVLDLTAGTVGPVVRVPAPPRRDGLLPTRHEIDPTVILTCVRRLLDELVCQAPDATGLVMCSQMHCVVLIDERGKPHSNVITWKDQRATECGVWMLRACARSASSQVIS